MCVCENTQWSVYGPSLPLFMLSTLSDSTNPLSAHISHALLLSLPCRPLHIHLFLSHSYSYNLSTFPTLTFSFPYQYMYTWFFLSLSLFCVINLSRQGLTSIDLKSNKFIHRLILIVPTSIDLRWTLCYPVDALVQSHVIFGRVSASVSAPTSALPLLFLMFLSDMIIFVLPPLSPLSFSGPHSLDLLKQRPSQ